MITRYGNYAGHYDIIGTEVKYDLYKLTLLFFLNK